MGLTYNVSTGAVGKRIAVGRAPEHLHNTTPTIERKVTKENSGAFSPKRGTGRLSSHLFSQPGKLYRAKVDYEFVPTIIRTPTIDPSFWALFSEAFDRGASDLHLSSDEVPRIRLDGAILPMGGVGAMPADLAGLFLPFMSDNKMVEFNTHGHSDFVAQVSACLRVRVNLYRHHQGEGAACRLLGSTVPTFEELSLPSTLATLASADHGLVLVTGATGSGKSTTLAAMIDRVNQTMPSHLVTIEDPIEFVHSSNRSRVTQREVGRDVSSFPAALRAALREDPDVILVGELRDLETIALALTAAETGHLVLATLHTRGAAAAVNRIVDVFPAGQQAHVRTMLADALAGVVSQELLPRLGGGRVPCVEILIATSAIRALIREGKTHQIDNVMQMSARDGMRTRSAHLRQLYASQSIEKPTKSCVSPHSA